MDKSGLSNQHNKLIFSTCKISEHLQTCMPLSMPTAEQCQRVRRNQEQNDQLQIKANELKKLFAEHQHRSSGCRSDPLSRSNSPEIRIEQETMLVHRKEDAEMALEKLSNTNTVTASVSSSLENSSSTLNYGNVLKNLSELSVSEESRGKFYSSYKQMRDEKLRKEWDTKKAEKEAKMKAMHDNFARSKAEMTARFSGNGETKHCFSDGLRCRKLLGSSDFGSSMMTEEAPPQEDLPNDEEEFQFQEEITQQHRIVEEEFLGDGISSRNQVQKLKTIKTSSLDSPQTSALPISLSFVKSFIPVTKKQEAQPYHIAKSVPKLSYVSKRNKKSSSQVTKTTSHPQLISYAQSKCCHEGTSTNKNRPEYLPLKRSSTIPVELKELSVLKSAVVSLNHLRFDGNQFDGNANNRLSGNMEINPSIWKDKRANPCFEANLVKSEARECNAVDPGTEANIGKLNAAVASEPQENKEKCDGLAFRHENSIESAKEEEEEDLENMEIDDFIEMSSEELRLIPNCDKFGISSSQNNEELIPRSHKKCSSRVKLVAIPDLHSVMPLQQSPDLSPMQRNSKLNSFSFSQVYSQIEPSASSPLQSPASCNSQTKTETGAGPQTRKEQEKSQKPLPDASSSHNKSTKRITKGFKKLLKFGKSKSETQSDQISVTTCEEISPTKREKNLSNRLSNDLNKSRMGFPQQTFTSDGCIVKSGSYHERDRMFSCIPGAPANFKLADYHRSRSSSKGFMCFARKWKANASLPLKSSPS